MRVFEHCSLAMMFCAVILCAQRAQAQGTADLVGRVSDASGGVLPGVRVTGAKVATQVLRTTITSEPGDYGLNPLLTGTHAVRIELPGCRTYTTRLRHATGD